MSTVPDRGANTEGRPVDVVVARVAALSRYPVKSMMGADVAELPLDALGAAGDRRWIVIDADGAQVTARVCHALLRIRPAYTDGLDGAIRLHADDGTSIEVAVPPLGAAVRAVHIWGDVVAAQDAGDAVASWLSQHLHRAVRLVRLAPTATRGLKPKYAGPLDPTGRTVAFPDGAPLLLLGLPSIAHLNERLVEAGATDVMDRRRFRANVWLEGLAPHAEDTWGQVRIGEVTLGCGSLCERCVLTTVDPDTAASGLEPLRTFATYRRQGSAVMFGVNATHTAPGVLRVGDEVRVLAWR
ncbi:MAG: MOSC domain-containing protein [Gemmatimonadetes bacterium]|nr:MOSC domain-containing protein [Gemmatimonadota bacterium]